LTNLSPGEYCLTVTDDNGCEFTNCYTVGATKTLQITGNITDVSCSGLDDGEVFVSGSILGGNPAVDEPYSFVWSSNAPASTDAATTSEITGLTTGMYHVTMTDGSGAGCEVIDSFEVIQPEPLAVSLLDQVNETCTSGNDGIIVAGVSGGTYPYNYIWSHDIHNNFS